MMKKKNCILTCFIPIGHYSIKSFQIHLNNLKRYCQKYDLDYFVLDTQIEKYNFNAIGQEHYKYVYYRFYIYQLLKLYERVLYIDSDMLFLQGCQNVFQLIPENKIGYVQMMNLQDDNIQKPVMKRSCNMYNKIYDTNIQSLNISGGFHLIPDMFIDQLQFSKLELKKATLLQPKKVFDVDYMDYFTSKFVNNSFKLPIEYNFLYPHKLFPNTQKFNLLRQESESGNIKIIHIVALSPQHLASIRYNHMLYFDNKFGVK